MLCACRFFALHSAEDLSFVEGGGGGGGGSIFFPVLHKTVRCRNSLNSNEYLQSMFCHVEMELK